MDRAGRTCFHKLILSKSNCQKMNDIILQDIYTRPDKSVPEYLEVLFLTNNGVYNVGVTSLSKDTLPILDNFTRLDFLDNLKAKYGELKIADARITYDNDKYFFIADQFILVLGYELNSYSEHSTQYFSIIEDISGLNKNEYEEFKQLDKLDVPWTNRQP